VRAGKRSAPQTQTGNHLSISRPTKLRDKNKKLELRKQNKKATLISRRSLSIPNGEPVKTFLLTPMNNFRSKIDKDLDRAFKEVRDGCGQPVLPR
jgi:hypothetical protein